MKPLQHNALPPGSVAQSADPQVPHDAAQHTTSPLEAFTPTRPPTQHPLGTVGAALTEGPDVGRGVGCTVGLVLLPSHSQAGSSPTLQLGRHCAN